jgi:hypothetical protein
MVAGRLRKILRNSDVPIPRLVITKNILPSAFVMPKAACMKVDATFIGGRALKNSEVSKEKSLAIENDPEKNDLKITGWSQPCLPQVQDTVSLRRDLEGRDIEFWGHICRLRPNSETADSNRYVFDCPESKTNFVTDDEAAKLFLRPKGPKSRISPSRRRINASCRTGVNVAREFKSGPL